MLAASAPAQAAAIAGGGTFSALGNVFVPLGGDLLFPLLSPFEQSTNPAAYAPVGSYGQALISGTTGGFAGLGGTIAGIQSLDFGIVPVTPFLLLSNFSTYTGVTVSASNLVFNSQATGTGQAVTVNFTGTISYFDTATSTAFTQALTGLVTTQFAGGEQVTSYSASFVIAEIPEPSPLVGVLALGLLGGIVVAYNRRKQAVSV